MGSTGWVRIAAIVTCVSCLALFAIPLRADDAAMTGMMIRASGMRGMLMLNSASGPISLVELTKNDPSPPPPYSNIGEVSIPVSTDRQVQGYFDQGLRFYYGFNNREFYRAFKYAAQRSLRYSSALRAVLLGYGASAGCRYQHVDPARARPRGGGRRTGHGA